MFKEKKQSHKFDYLQLAIITMQADFGECLTRFRKVKNTVLPSQSPTVNIDLSLLNISTLTGVNQPGLEIELADNSYRSLLLKSTNEMMLKTGWIYSILLDGPSVPSVEVHV